MESKRMDTFREVHEALKKTAKTEQAFLRDFFDKTRDMWRDDDDEDINLDKSEVVTGPNAAD
jgi:hypothetical protein